jgi:class 3 adenylate cyclase
VGRGGPNRGRELSIRSARVIEAPRDLTFGVMADTNRWNHLVGSSRLTHDNRLRDPDDPTSRTRIGTGSFLGLRQVFAEEGELWVGDELRASRHFFDCWTAGPIPRAFYYLKVSDAGTDDRPRTRAEIRAGVEVAGILGYLMAPLLLLRFKLAARKLLRSVDRAALAARRPTGTDPLPPAALARRSRLAAAGDDRPIEIAGDEFGRTSREALQARATEFARTPVPRDLQRRLLDLLAYQPDDNLRRLRPFELAASWGVDRRELLRAFLYATASGLFDLEWQVNCPTCRVGTGTLPALDQVEERVHCGECDIAFDVGFAENVEATFTANPAIRDVPPLLYCGSSPYYLPHLHGYLPVPPRSSRTAGPLPAGDLLLRTRGAPRQIVVAAGERDGSLAIQITDDAIEVVDAPAGGDELTIDNRTDRPVRLLVEHAGWDAAIARGSLLFTMPEFYRLFSAEAPAAGLSLSVGTFAVAFTDVVGSTEMYQRLGDARAFALIQEHWRACTEIVGHRGGAVVKTMGDGLMCCFASTADAIAASFEMIHHTQSLSSRAQGEFAIRVGVNEGPCYAIRTSGQLDLFGNTVNVAARLMSAADGSEIALTRAAVDHPALAALLDDDTITTRTETATLRGMRAPMELVFASRAGAAVFATGDSSPVGARA